MYGNPVYVGPAKAESNLRKHGVAFEEAAEVLLDPLCVVEPNHTDEDGFWRWQGIGSLKGILVLVVIHIIFEEKEGKIFTSSRHALLNERREKSMKTKMVSYTAETLPRITAKRMAELKALAARPDSEIDFSDIPPLTDEFWKNAVPNPLYRPNKTSTTVRIDNDVLVWLRGQGKGYQSRMNAILRSAMLRSIRKSYEGETLKAVKS